MPVGLSLCHWKKFFFPGSFLGNPEPMRKTILPSYNMTSQFLQPQGMKMEYAIHQTNFSLCGKKWFGNETRPQPHFDPIINTHTEQVKKLHNMY